MNCQVLFSQKSNKKKKKKKIKVSSAVVVISTLKELVLQNVSVEGKVSDMALLMCRVI